MLDEKEYYGALDPEIQKQAKQYARIHRWGERIAKACNWKI
ncbi:MAG: hypothetical protein MHPDNHAH_03484 [Anaerolineales bacterium]|nr:hypothetical protein [Anaerolineales bacterium]WKZ48340.1 MAG: hypothetical protein QY306_03095 [Anaerolineales bacterium]